MLPRFFTRGVAVANHAESGESVAGFLSARRFDKIFSTIKPGDYLFLQFGHNDMKSRRPDALEGYERDLTALVERAREHGATPVLVTSMERKAGVEKPTLGDYPETVRQVAAATATALIDLNQTSLVLYQGLGDDFDAAFQDGTHHTNFGSYQFAKCVIEGIQANHLDLAKFIVPEFESFDPAHPDRYKDFHLPASPKLDKTKPEGS
jgi:lysophospholipase L1-like esterase